MPTISAHPYNRVGTTDPNYLGVTLPGLNAHLSKGAQFSTFNAADRLGGFFINTLIGVHTKSEVPAVRTRLRSAVAKATVDSYFDHLRVNGDSLLAALSTLRSADAGSAREAYAEEKSIACNRYNVLANTANYNFAFVHTSARHAVYTASYYNQQTDFFQASSKFFWFRAEKHFQVQAATAGRYVTEAAEDSYKVHYEQSEFKSTQIEEWEILDDPDLPATIRIKLGKLLDLRAKEIYIAALEKLVVQVSGLYLEATTNLHISSQQQVYISGTQIFLGSSARSKQKPPELPEKPTVVSAALETLPAYARTLLARNQQQPAVAQGTTLFNLPPI
jgi:hypothetical protein